MTQVPQEITDLILDSVSSLQCDAIPSLRACALTCRSFVKQSQYHIFHTVKFKSERMSRLQLFFDALMSTPELGLHVRVFRLQESNSDRTWHTIGHRHLPTVLSMLKNVIDFGLGVSCGNLNWNVFSSSLKHALTGICFSPSIRSLSLYHINSVPTIFAEWFAGASTVVIQGCTCNSGKNPEQLTLITRANNRMLTICCDGNQHNMKSIMDALLSPQCVLKKLIVKLYHANNLPIAQKIMVWKPSLTSIEFAGPSAEEYFIPRLDIGAVPRLKAITVLADLDTSDYPFCIAEEVLETARFNNDIREITIQLSFSDFSDILKYEWFKWEGIDKLLTEPQFAQLLEVCVTDAPIIDTKLVPGIVPREYADVVMSFIERSLPRLYGKGLLQVTLHSIR
ncbi:hypothetical protein BDQ17DRAFT_107184 [Cyathus striatus]|nr:hypothetical protein BDQ17DRAFT_107184 [Cyathus striatus]